jgi:Rad52/22 family double-strand break repair protein
MPFSEAQAKLLSGKLNEKVVRTRQERGKTLSYIEGWHAIAEANRVFGFEGWERETVVAECVWQDVKREPKACAYAARVRIRVRAGETVVCREGSGVGQGTGATLGEAHAVPIMMRRRSSLWPEKLALTLWLLSHYSCSLSARPGT